MMQPMIIMQNTAAPGFACGMIWAGLCIASVPHATGVALHHASTVQFLMQT